MKTQKILERVSDIESFPRGHGVNDYAEEILGLRRAIHSLNWFATRGTATQIEAAGRATARSVLKLPRANTLQTLDCFQVPLDVVMFVGHIRGGAPSALQIWIDDSSYMKLIPVPC